MKFPRRFAALAAAIAAFVVLTTGCHQPTFDQLQPAKLKWSVSVIAVAESDEQKNSIQELVGKLAGEHAMATNVTWLDKPADAAATLEQVASTPGVDLVLLGADADNLQTVAQKHPNVRFGVLGEGSAAGLANVRALTTDHKRKLFLAGFLGAEANKESSAPFSVYVDKTRSASDDDWQWVLAGVRFAGRKDTPVQVTTSGLLPTTGSTTTERATLSGRALVLLDEMPDEVWAKIRDRGMKLIRTDQSTKGLAVQSNHVAQPSNLLVEAFDEESRLLHDGKWTAGQQVELAAKHIYRLTQPGLFLDKSLATRLELIEDQLTTGALKPETYLAGQVNAR
ncbi:hypothetical protein [Tumebacillus permanentifrigoris]|uniref:Uncharacterized protein n=1 Tax=Tumebacillus permanentifrigoris TaxID=378543 RepID=A0A316DBV5_9BACL|nr:hypothetical protein [Tumebacillus permanentifrigoris]PWK15484.1 hypothetical protein C7459_10320 [Tumebacillus permanentifrigoris]